MRIPRPVARLVARTKPFVPERAWPALLTARSLAGPGPVLGLPDLRRALVLAAHPDDESMGAAGTLALLTRAGTDVHVAFATDGDGTRGSARPAGETAARRRAEARQACTVLGVPTPPTFLGLPDGGLPTAVPALAGHVTALVERHRPEAVLLPWFLDGHRDHQAMTAALALADVPDALEVWAFEIWTPVPVNRLVDITAVVDTKRAALAAHATAHEAFDVSVALALSRWRSVHAMMGAGSAEAFLVAPVRDYLALAARADQHST